MNKRVLWLLLVMMFGVIGVVWSGGKSESDNSGNYKMQIEHDENVATVTHTLMTGFAEKIKNKSNGRLQIEIFPSCSLSGGSINTMINNTQIGSVDASIIASNLLSTWEPRIDILHLPFFYAGIDEMKKIGRDSAVMKNLYAEFEGKLGLVILDSWARAFRQAVNKKRPINTVEDFKGLKLRLPETPLWVDAFTALGVEVSTMPFSEVPQAMQLGMVDGAERGTEFLRSEKWWDMGKYVTMTNHCGEMLIVAVNASKWKTLPADLQQLVSAEIKLVGDEKIQKERELENSVLSDLRSHGMQITEKFPESERSKIIRTVEPVWQKYTPKIGNKLVQDVLAILKE